MTILVITKTDDLIKALFGDVLLLCVSAAIHRRYEWVWGAVWLFMLPVYLTINLLVTEVVYQGLLMGVLGVNYYIAGYALGRRALRQGAPFLAAAAFLSVLVPIMAWSNSLVAALTLGLIAALYLLALCG